MKLCRTLIGCSLPPSDCRSSFLYWPLYFVHHSVGLGGSVVCSGGVHSLWNDSCKIKCLPMSPSENTSGIKHLSSRNRERRWLVFEYIFGRTSTKHSPHLNRETHSMFYASLLAKHIGNICCTDYSHNSPSPSQTDKKHTKSTRVSVECPTHAK